MPQPGAAIFIGCRSPLRPQFEWRLSVLVAAAAHQHLAPDGVAHVRLDETEYGVRHIARADDSDVSRRASRARFEIRARQSVQHRDRRGVLDLGLIFVHWARSCVEYTGEEPTANWNMLIVSPGPDRPSGRPAYQKGLAHRQSLEHQQGLMHQQGSPDSGHRRQYQHGCVHAGAPVRARG